MLNIIKRNIHHIGGENDKKNNLYIHCNSYFKIDYINDFACKILEYRSEELIGKELTILMPKYLANLHKELFKTTYLNCCVKMKKMEGKSKTFVLISKNNYCINCFGKIGINDDRTSYMELSIVEHVDSPLVPNEYMKFINNKASFHIKQYNNICCLMFDIANSTPFVNLSSSSEVALLFHNLYKEVDKIIMRYFFPFVNIHETCGDNFFLLVNINNDCTKNCASLSIECGLKIINELNTFLDELDYSLHIRCGVSFGNISAGVIDGRSFRAFGSVIHMASRLEGACPKNKIAIDDSILEKYKKESTLDDIGNKFHIENSQLDLKGFGFRNVYFIENKN